jgi:hypothetical protein
MIYYHILPKMHPRAIPNIKCNVSPERIPISSEIFPKTNPIRTSHRFGTPSARITTILHLNNPPSKQIPLDAKAADRSYKYLNSLKKEKEKGCIITVVSMSFLAMLC